VTQRPVTRPGEPAPVSDDIAIEEPLEIRVASSPVATTMRTPGDDALLAVGFLYSEGIVRAWGDVGTVTHCGRPGDEGYGNTIDVYPAPGAVLDLERVESTRRGTLTTAACGVCGRQRIDDLLALCTPVPPREKIPRSTVLQAMAALGAAQDNFRRTGGVHGAVALTSSGATLAAYEDIGRHNAVDKVVGALVKAQRVAAPLLKTQRLGGNVPPALPPDEACAVLAVSGRASFEIVQKAAVAGIPIVASVSAASSLAIDLAERAGIALVGFLRGERFNLYTHPARIG
jgi:FdhD protein